MVQNKNLEIANKRENTGLTTYFNSKDEIVISCGKFVSYDSENAVINFSGIITLDEDDLSELIRELKYFLKQSQENAF
jgi:hypothetical protein